MCFHFLATITLQYDLFLARNFADIDIDFDFDDKDKDIIKLF